MAASDDPENKEAERKSQQVAEAHELPSDAETPALVRPVKKGGGAGGQGTDRLRSPAHSEPRGRLRELFGGRDPIPLTSQKTPRSGRGSGPVAGRVSPDTRVPSAGP